MGMQEQLGTLTDAVLSEEVARSAPRLPPTFQIPQIPALYEMCSAAFTRSLEKQPAGSISHPSSEGRSASARRCGSIKPVTGSVPRLPMT